MSSVYYRLNLILIVITCLWSSVEAVRNGSKKETSFKKSVAAERFKETFSFLKNTPNSRRKFLVHFVQFPEGNYTGELNALRMRDGWGEMEWAAGSTYGPGNMFVHADGDRYVGQWKNHLQHGKLCHVCSITFGRKRSVSQ